MPGVTNNPKGKKYNNLLELLFDKRAELPAQVKSYLTTVTSEGRFIASRTEVYSNKENMAEYAEFCYTVNTAMAFHQEKPCLPLQFVVEKKMFSFVPILLSLGANHLLDDYDYFTKIVANNAPLDVIEYCVENNKLCDDKKFDALVASYNNKLKYYFNKFEVIHRYCFGLSFCEILDGKPPEGMSLDNYNNHILNHRDFLMRDPTLMMALKKIYIDILKFDNTYKSKLKISLALEHENTITTIIQTNAKNTEPSETPEYVTLKTMLASHKLTPNDLKSIRVLLDSDEKPNPTLAALYFSYENFDCDADYDLFKKHLVNISAADYSPASKNRLTNLLKAYLSNSELVMLKSRIDTMVIAEKIERDIEWTVSHTPPFIEIAITGRSSRGPQSSETFRKIFDHHLVRVDSPGYERYFRQISGGPFALFKSPKTPKPQANMSGEKYPEAYVSPKPSAPPQ